MVAAARTGRRYVGYDLDPNYVDIARERIRTEIAPDQDRPHSSTGIDASLVSDPGAAAHRIVQEMLLAAGFTITQTNFKVRGTGISLPFEVTNTSGDRLWVEIGGPHRSLRGGLSRTDTVLRCLGRAAAIRHARGEIPLIVLTTQMPLARSEAATVLSAACAPQGQDLISAVIDLSDPAGRDILAGLAGPKPEQ
jgi:site-specific DNA-methyltransferase (adenine-specific)